MFYYIDGLTQQEVADLVGCSRKTVKQRLARFKDIAMRLIKRAPKFGGTLP